MKKITGLLLVFAMLFSLYSISLAADSGSSKLEKKAHEAGALQFFTSDMSASITDTSVIFEIDIMSEETNGLEKEVGLKNVAKVDIGKVIIGDKLLVKHGPAGGSNQILLDKVTPKQWYKVTIDYDFATGKMDTYLNGEKKNKTPLVIPNYNEGMTISVINIAVMLQNYGTLCIDNITVIEKGSKEFIFEERFDDELGKQFTRYCNKDGSSRNENYAIDWSEINADTKAAVIPDLPKKDEPKKDEPKKDDDFEIIGDTQTVLEMVVDKLEAKANGKVSTLDQAATILNGRTVIPARFIAENLGATVAWDANTRTVTITSGTTKIEIVIDNNIAKVNGKDVTLDQSATIINGRTVVPARFIAENLGATVDWNPDTKTVTVTK